MPIRFDHDSLNPLLEALIGDLNEQSRSARATSPTPIEGVDPLATEAAAKADEETSQHSDKGASDAEKALEASRSARKVSDDSAAAIRGSDLHVGDNSPATHTTADSGTSPQMQTSAGGYDPAVIDQYNRQVAAVSAYNQQQAQAWQSAMAQQQYAAQMAQMNAAAQQQAVAQVASQPTISSAEVQQIINELYADDASHTGSAPLGEGAEALPASDVDDLGGAEGVSLDKSSSGTLSEQEVAQIIDKACDLNGVSDDPQVREAFRNVWTHMALHESGFNANAANGWDSNATGAIQSDGFPANSSRGMWQCIPSTFSANHVSGTSNSIYDPLASCAASIRYTMERYGVSPDGQGLQEFAANRGIDAVSGNVTGGYLGY